MSETVIDWLILFVCLFTRLFINLCISSLIFLGIPSGYTVNESPSEKVVTGKPNLIVIVLVLLAIFILVMLAVFGLLFVRRRRSHEKKCKSGISCVCWFVYLFVCLFVCFSVSFVVHIACYLHYKSSFISLPSSCIAFHVLPLLTTLSWTFVNDPTRSWAHLS